MRKKISLLIGMLLLLTGCAKSQEENNTIKKQEDNFVVVASFYPIEILALNLTQNIEGVTVKNMTQNQKGCLHDYQLTTEDMKKLEGASLLLINGGGMEPFLEDILKQNPSFSIVDTSEGIEEENSHFWLSPFYAAIQAENMKDALCVADPAHKEEYEDNFDVFLEKLASIKQEYQKLDFQEMPVGIFHEGFSYFTDLCNMKPEISIFSDENQTLSAKELSQAVEKVKSSQISLLLTAEEEGKATSEAIAAEAGGKILILNPITGGERKAEAYFDASIDNLERLKGALEK